MPIYASPEQFMRDRSEYARKGISRGRSVVVTTFSGGVLFVAENHSPTLHKVSEIYDRIGFAAVGRYNEFENLRTAGIRLADVRGFSYDRRDVTGRWLANAYAQTVGSIFSEHQKPFEVELCVAEVSAAGAPGWAGTASAGVTTGADQLYRISYDGSIVDERRFVVMGGATEPVIAALTESFTPGWDAATALAAAVSALGTAGEGAPRTLQPTQLEVAVLDRALQGRTFRRIQGAALAAMLSAESSAPASAEAATAAEAPQSPADGVGTDGAGAS
ncbi:MAG TPA: proteasome subunit alpha [Nakamurella sp.]|nr:proteasome subunit alpha [Nakamurella sp.]